MKKSRLLMMVCACAFTNAILINAIGAPVLVNGSLTGTAGNTTATPWTITSGYPGIVDANGPANNTGVPWTLSPDGGTFARCVGSGVSGITKEDAFEQTLSGFTIGASYTLQFYLTNLGWFVGTEWRNHEGYWGLFVNNTLVGRSTVIDGPINPSTTIQWYSDSITFTATDTVQTLRLVAFTANPIIYTGGLDGKQAYMGIDGLRLLDGGVVPLPDTLVDKQPAPGTNYGGLYSNAGSGNERNADDFSLSTPTQVNTISWYGWFPHVKPAILTGDFDILFFYDDAGLPSNPPFYSTTATDITGTETGITTEFGASIIKWTATIPTANFASAGDYWLSVQGHPEQIEYITSWIWAFANPIVGESGAAFENEGSNVWRGFSAADGEDLTDAFAFSLTGTSMPVADADGDGIANLQDNCPTIRIRHNLTQMEMLKAMSVTLMMTMMECQTLSRRSTILTP